MVRVGPLSASVGTQRIGFADASLHLVLGPMILQTAVTPPEPMDLAIFVYVLRTPVDPSLHTQCTQGPRE